MQFRFRNVNDAFRGLVKYFEDPDVDHPVIRQPSRVGSVLRIPEPTMVTYERPLERVLFNRARDCNPFFHLFEALWMLAGRNDVEPLAYYNPRMREFSDDGKTLHGAYGHRWRERWRDQVRWICEELKLNPSCRRQVLQVWDQGLDLGVQGKDHPCNTHAYFSMREATRLEIETHAHNGYLLDMTVCNRSNDLVWGMLGANFVHFSMLQEYMAARIGVGVGVYHQFTNNLHVYTERFTPDVWLADKEPDHYWGPSESLVRRASMVPLVQDPERFDEEVREFIDASWGQEREGLGSLIELHEPFLLHVASPMCRAFWNHKERDYGTAMRVVSEVQADDWRIAGENWLRKRAERYQDRNQYPVEVRDDL